jgi:hypothetical protein
MDLGGEQIDLYPRHSSMGNNSHYTEYEGGGGEMNFNYDEPDEIKMSAVIELLLKTADVAHCMQSWTLWTKWSCQMFKELAAAHSDGSGHDPAPSWFENQISIMEHYILPLAGKLYDVGIFGDIVGSTFTDYAEENIDDWLIKGSDLSDSLKQKASKKIKKKEEMYFL